MNYEKFEIELANEIADTLDDRESLPLFLGFAQKYKEEHLRRILKRVMNLPDDQIKKTRGALFTYLIKNFYAGGQHSRD